MVASVPYAPVCVCGLVGDLSRRDRCGVDVYLVSPPVAAGLHVMRNAGWRTRICQTMQTMGVA